MLRRVSKELHRYVTWVLKRDGIAYSAQDKGEYVEILMKEVSSRRFSTVVEDAKCEKQRRNSSCPDIPVLSYRAAMNTARMDQLLDLYGAADCFVMLESDEQKFIDTVKNI